MHLALLFAMTTLTQPSASYIGYDDANVLLFGATAYDKCKDGDEHARIACLIGARYAADKTAKATALALYEKTGTIAGILPEQDFDGNYRGILHLVPRVPTGALRTHLEWTAAALNDFDDLFTKIDPAHKTRFTFQPLGLRFFESVKRRTPSAFARGWTVSYNVSGSLFTSKDRVRETFFHELFHVNDEVHGSGGAMDGRYWSETHLASIYDAIVAVCGKDKACLQKYTPDEIVVVGKGGTYYDFMPDNGVHDYAADIGKRWYVENRRVQQNGGAAPKGFVPWKCNAPENAKAWALVVDEFFGGLDTTPQCPPVTTASASAK